MDSQHIQVGGKPMSVYTAAQVRDVLDEANRLDRRGIGCIVVDAAVRKLDSLNQGRMDA